MKKRLSNVFIIMLMLCLCSCSNESASTAIVGGADGPTAVFIASQIDWPSVCGLIGVVAAAVLVVILLFRNKKKK